MAEGDEENKMIFDAFIYQMAKAIGAAATVLKGKVDQVVVTGGIAYSDFIFSSVIIFSLQCETR